ncbi:MAG TPA: T9SS type A sorting domain-containing protein [Bacteroidia bacterium]|nr:T9SS type A sorting domain-containing protein [Bacteroidia bacterium]
MFSQEFENDDIIKVYPNPSHVVTIDLSLFDDFQTFDLFIYNQEGKLFIKRKLKGNKKIEINDLLDGLYLINIQGKSKTISKKIIVLKNY